MKYKQHALQDLEGIGEGSITIISEKLLSAGIVENFANTVRDLDVTPEKKLQFECQKEFEPRSDSEVVLYHLVCYFGALLRLRSVHYIKTKKLFSDYVDDTEKVIAYTRGLESGLLNYHKIAHLDKLQTAIPQVVDNRFTYNEKIPLDRISLPYFYDVDFTENTYAELSNSLAQILGLIREPTFAQGSGVPFQHLIKELDLHSLAISFLEGVFIKR